MKGGSASLLGWVLGLQTVAQIIVLPFGGVIADKFGRVKVLALSDIVGGSVLIYQSIRFIGGHPPIWVLFFSEITFGVTMGLFWPSFGGLMPAIVDEKDLQKANSTLQFVANLAIIMGTAVGGFIVATLGSTLALFIDSCTFVLCGLLVWTMHKLVPPSKSETSMIDDLVHGWKIFLSFKWIAVVVAAFTFIVMVWAGAEQVLGPKIALQYFDGAKSWAQVLGCETFGFVVGSLIGMRIRPKYPMRFMMIMTSVIVFYIYAMAVHVSVWTIALGGFAVGVMLDLWGAIWGTALQKEVPREALSRVSAFDAFGSVLFRPIGLIIAAPMAEWLGLTQTLEIFAGVTAVAIVATLLVPEVWKMQLSRSEV